MNRILAIITRTKHLTPKDFAETKLNRCLTTADLTALAISSTVGTGIYVLTGEVTRLKTGPSVILSFTIAAFVSILCCLCYAEFGARFPKAGSAYIYSYVTIGELCAFTIGWNLLLEYIVGTAATARTWGSFTDALFNNRIQDAIESTVGKMHSPLLAEYPDFLAFTAVIAVVVVIALGVKQSVSFNWFFLVLNFAVIVFITISGLVLADIDNWSDFFPFGFSGTMAGAAILFYSFVGFDVVGSCGEEAKTPTTSIPNAMIACLVISLSAYIAVSVALTLMLPFDQLTQYVSIAYAFEQRGFPVGKYLVALGAVFALLCGITGQIFPLPRILYSMANDGLVFHYLGHINEKTGTPLLACFIGGLLTALLSLLLDIISLVEMLSIGTLLAYTIVALCVLLLRYRPGNVGIQIETPTDACSVENDEEIKTVETDKESTENTEHNDSFDLTKDNQHHIEIPTLTKSPQETEVAAETKETAQKVNAIVAFYNRLVAKGQSEPNSETYHVVKVAAAIFVFLSIFAEALLIYGLNSFTSFENTFVTLVFLLSFSLLFVVHVIACQPQSQNKLPFMVPLVPLVPLASIFMNIYLILMLSFYTWVRFAIWMVIGMSIYIFYGVKHSKENPYSPFYGTPSDEYSRLESDEQETEK